MLGIGDRIPQMEVRVQRGLEDSEGSLRMLGAPGDRWTILIFWPRDFTSVCPTEVIAFGEYCDQFDDRGADLVGASVDSAIMHLAWRKSDPRLAECDFDWIADNHNRLAEALGIFHPSESRARRVTFVIDPEGVIQHVTANADNVGRNPAETLRVLDALQTEEECPVNWQPGDPVLNPERQAPFTETEAGCPLTGH